MFKHIFPTNVPLYRQVVVWLERSAYALNPKGTHMIRFGPKSTVAEISPKSDDTFILIKYAQLRKKTDEILRRIHKEKSDKIGQRWNQRAQFILYRTNTVSKWSTRKISRAQNVAWRVSTHNFPYPVVIQSGFERVWHRCTLLAQSLAIVNKNC